jgi:hypothetical protein
MDGGSSERNMVLYYFSEAILLGFCRQFPCIKKIFKIKFKKATMVLT